MVQQARFEASQSLLLLFGESSTQGRGMKTHRRDAVCQLQKHPRLGPLVATATLGPRENEQETRNRRFQGIERKRPHLGPLPEGEEAGKNPHPGPPPCAADGFRGREKKSTLTPRCARALRVEQGNSRHQGIEASRAAEETERRNRSPSPRSSPRGRGRVAARQTPIRSLCSLCLCGEPRPASQVRDTVPPPEDTGETSRATGEKKTHGRDARATVLPETLCHPSHSRCWCTRSTLLLITPGDGCGPVAELADAADLKSAALARGRVGSTPTGPIASRDRR